MECIADACPVPPPNATAEPTFPGTGTTTQCETVVVYYNTAQTYVNSCPVGSPTPPITVTTPEHTYLSYVDQADADNQAMAAAEAAADAQRELSPCEPAPSLLLEEDGTSFILLEDGVTYISLY